MNDREGRRMRRIFDGTGVYIALFLVVTALAVAGYWTLIPRGASPAQTPAKLETPAPVAQTPVVTAPKPQPIPTPPRQEPEEPALPTQSTVTVVTVAPEPRVTEPVVPAAPALIVHPLEGETLAVFSMDALLYSETMGDWRTHDGLDIAAEPGTPVCAACAGKVVSVRDDDLLGTTVVVSHADGYETLYANLQSEPAVKVGDYVTAGPVLGSVGKTALSESAMAPHLHFAVSKDGEAVDPEEYLK